MDLVFRAYNEGVAFRYVAAEAGRDGSKFKLASEDTGFYFARDVSAFALNMGRFNTHNEGEYLRTPLSDDQAGVDHQPAAAGRECPAGRGSRCWKRT